MVKFILKLMEVFTYYKARCGMNKQTLMAPRDLQESISQHITQD